MKLLHQLVASFCLPFSFHASAALLYVDLNSTNPAPPYADWSTAASDIQSAIDASADGDLILVTNGVYQTGGQTVNGYALTNRVVINKAVTVQSINGPAVTAIQGNQPIGDNAVRCVYMTNSATLIGFMLTNGATLNGFEDYGINFGGGLYCESVDVAVSNCVITGCAAGDSGGGVQGGTLNNCVLTGNQSYNGAGANGAILTNCVLVDNSGSFGGGTSWSLLVNCTLASNFSTWYGLGGGGGAYDSTLINCTLVANHSDNGGGAYGDWWSPPTLSNCLFYNNSADGNGGGAESCNLNNCTLAGNSAPGGGGADSSTLNNCIIYYNTGPGVINYTGSTLNYCCTTPDPGGIGNITNEALFVNLAGEDFHLQSNSPCINSGNNAYVTATNELDGNPRIQGGTVDIGAYEYQTPASIISYAWLQQYGLPTDGSVDYADSDATGMNNWQKWIAGLSPDNPASVLAMLTPVAANNSTGVTVSWQSVNTRTYYLQSSTNLAAQPAFSTIQSNIIGQVGTTSYTDTTATNAGPYFYRVGVQ